METRQSPGHFEDAALDAIAKGDWSEAASLYRAAAGASIGHGRAEWYQERAEEADKIAKRLSKRGVVA